jgi:hypothetical protein
MENEIKKLLETVDKAMSSADILKKASIGNDFNSFSAAL